MSTPQRYNIRHTFQTPYTIHLEILHAETLSDAELAADMPSIHEALQRQLENVRRERAWQAPGA